MAGAGFTAWGTEGYGFCPVAGAPGIGIAGNAIQVWSLCQGRTVTVAEAALAFNVTPSLILAAVEDHYWMLIGVNAAGEDTIEHEGE